MKKTGKEEKGRTSGQPSRCWREGCYGGCPKIEFAGTRVIKYPRRYPGAVRYHAPDNAVVLDF